MSRLLDLIRKSALSSHHLMTAAKGALQAPAEEMVEILVYLAENNKIFAETARITLAGWDENSAKAIVSNPATPKEVLNYWLSPKNIRPGLFPLLLENSTVSVRTLCEAASTMKGEWIDAMLGSPRVQQARAVLQELVENKQLSGVQTVRAQELLAASGAILGAEVRASGTPAVIAGISSPGPTTAEPVATSDVEDLATKQPEAAPPDSGPALDPEIDKVVAAFLSEHAKEIAAEADKPFQPIGGIHEEASAVEPQAAAAAAAAAPTAAPAKAPATAKLPSKKPVNPEDEQRGSVLQKIAKLDVKGRIHLAMKGNKEERSILVRDGTKIVALAVLDSPKITDGEVEKFANQKNVLEALLRAIPMKRRFVKNYVIVRNLVANPRTPLDVGLGLIKNLLVQDLRNLSGNKEVSETVRKVALRMFKQKLEPGKN
ncbi:MAG TPA: hypothetical protein VHV29_21225 [Terriglobales bacterium]|jgi:hypothetical protein|nr:hypothetical protein [Terriglobales bacterium]